MRRLILTTVLAALATLPLAGVADASASTYTKSSTGTFPARTQGFVGLGCNAKGNDYRDGIDHFVSSTFSPSGIVVSKKTVSNVPGNDADAVSYTINNKTNNVVTYTIKITCRVR